MTDHLLALLAGCLIGFFSFTRLVTPRLAPDLTRSDIQVLRWDARLNFSSLLN